MQLTPGCQEKYSYRLDSLSIYQSYFMLTELFHITDGFYINLVKLMQEVAGIVFLLQRNLKYTILNYSNETENTS